MELFSHFIVKLFRIVFCTFSNRLGSKKVAHVSLDNSTNVLLKHEFLRISLISFYFVYGKVVVTFSMIFGSKALGVTFLLLRHIFFLILHSANQKISKILQKEQVFTIFSVYIIHYKHFKEPIHYYVS